MNSTQPQSCINPTAEKIGKPSSYFLIFIVSLIGNILIGVIVFRTPTMRRPINFLIVNMAMSDLLFPLFQFPRTVIELYVDTWMIRGPLGVALCKIVPFVGIVSALVSIQTLVLIAVDRFGAVFFPFRSLLVSSKLCGFLVFTTWITATVVMWPNMSSYKLVESPEGLKCTRQWEETFGESVSFKKYILAMFVVFSYVPIIVIAILYLAILLKLRSDSHKIRDEQSVNAGEIRARREKNVLKMSIAIVLTFAICWLPFSFYWVLVLFSLNRSTSASCGLQYFNAIVFFVWHSNCAINPCICFIYAGNYRQGLKNIFICSSSGQQE